jgi:ATP-dependent Clp protease ATP-binding subunit ClpA
MNATLEPLIVPRWLRDLERFLPLKSQFVLSGNIRDLQLTSSAGSNYAQALIPKLAQELRARGYGDIVIYEPFQGFSTLGESGVDSQGDNALRTLGLEPANGRAAAGIELLAQTLERLVQRDGPPIALIVDYASRLIVRPDTLSAAEHLTFTRALMASYRARSRPVGQPPRPYFNTVLWVVEKEGDLPDWFLVSNPRVRHIPISLPDHLSRRALGASLVRTLDGASQATTSAIDDALEQLVDNTEGLLLADLAAIAQLGRSERLSYAQVGDAVRRYKIGVTEDPWAKIDRSKIVRSFESLNNRVRGQSHAVTHVLDIIKRAITGVGASRRGGRPRGVAFLAGPTGVGKTELAKAITELLFGDESAYIRFDMSEFSAEHSDQRLIGAPPGYVGYDVGGELTNAIREKPFAVVLFDEIEKAHPRILDKFLQVLDDGVLTSGRGDRVYFSEAFVIFTSNLGIYQTNEQGQRVLNIQPTEPLDEIRRRVRAEIDQHFKVVLNRPELLNRIGENIVIFDFIRDEVASQIFEGMIANVLHDLELTQRIKIQLSSQVHATVKGMCLRDLTNGGRGIRNQVEVHLINPLARALFDSRVTAGESINVTRIETGTVTSLELARNV